MLSAEDKLRVVASPSHKKETTTAGGGGGGGRASPEQLDLFAEPSATDTAPRVIPFTQPNPEEPGPEPTPKPLDSPSHDIDFPPSCTPYDQWPDKFTKIPFAIAGEYGRKLKLTQTPIFEVMHDMIHGYTEEQDEEIVQRRRRGQISQKEIAKAAGVGLRTVQRYMPQLIKAGFVQLISPGRRNQSAAVYKLIFKAPIPQSVGPSGGQAVAFPDRGTTAKLAGQDDRTTAKLASKYLKERKNKSRSRSSKGGDPTRGTTAAAPAAGNGNKPRAGPDAGLERWPESVKAIRAPEFFPSLRPKEFVSIFAKAQPHGLTDEELAAVVGRYGAEVRQTHPKGENPLVWGYELVDCALREKEARRKKTRSAPESRPREQAVGESPVEPTGRVRLFSKTPCTNHEKHQRPMPVFWFTDKGERRCVHCERPPEELVAEARQMVQCLEEKRRSGAG